MEEKKGVELAGELAMSGETGNRTTRGPREKVKSPHANRAYGAPGFLAGAGTQEQPDERFENAIESDCREE